MAKRHIEVIAPSTRVTIHRQGNSSIAGTVVSVQIGHGPSVRYEVAWWKIDERKTEWFEPHEVSVADHQAKPMKIGFVAEASE